MLNLLITKNKTMKTPKDKLNELMNSLLHSPFPTLPSHAKHLASIVAQSHVSQSPEEDESFWINVQREINNLQ